MRNQRRRFYGKREKFITDTAGFSLVEVIIVIAVVSILAGASIGLFGHIRYANTRKAAEQICRLLDKQQVNSMSGTDNQALYIYKTGGGYYMRVVSGATADPYAALTGDGVKIANSDVTIKRVKGASEYEVTGNTSASDDGNCIKIVYKRSGIFDTTKTNTEKIKIIGSSEHTVTLVMQTGKCVRD